MSNKTLRLSNEFPTVLTAERVAPLKVRALACAIGLLVLGPAASFGLELGEATIRSSLGQSLLVEIPYRLAADERLAPSCVSLAPAARADDALPTYTRASRVAITPTHIEIIGDSRVLEPLIGITVDVHCNAAPRFLRSYELFVDPPARVPAIPSNGARFAAAPTAAMIDAATPIAREFAPANGSTASAAATATPRASVSARARGQSGGNLTQGQTYQVVRGDTLSGIAARVGDRPMTIRETAEAIFAANSGAFTRGNRDLLEAGRSITIPIMTAVTAAVPAPAADSDSVPAARELEPTTATPLPATEPAPENASSEAPAETIPSIAPDPVEARAAGAAAPQPSAVPIQGTDDVAPASAPSAATGRASMWLTALLALGVVVVLSAPLLFLRRRKNAAETRAAPKRRSSQPRQLVDPVAGFDVVEAELPRTSTGSSEKTKPVESLAALATPPDSLALEIGPVDSVDLDVGMPTMVDQRVDWFADRPAATLAAKPVADAASIENAPTARMPGMDTRSAEAEAADTIIEDEQYTLTVVELDMLRQDYETEHTLTQAGSKELRDAVADLKATQAARAANADTATLEMPQPAQSESIETQPTQRLRSSR